MKVGRFPGRLGVFSTLLGFALAGCGGAEGGDGRDAAAHFLDQLRAGRLEPAWQETTPEFKSLMGMENLRDYVKAHPALKGSAAHAEARNSDRGNGPMVEHIFRAEARVRGKTVPATVKVLVAPGDKGWGVEQLRVE